MVGGGGWVVEAKRKDFFIFNHQVNVCRWRMDDKDVPMLYVEFKKGVPHSLSRLWAKIERK